MDQQERGKWFATHILPYEAEVRRWLYKQAPTLLEEDVDDIIQDAYANIWTVLDLSRIREGRPYLYKVARNFLLGRVRRARVISIEPIGEIDVPCISSEAPGPEREVHAQQLLELVRTAIARLPARCRRTFELRRFDGLSYEEIAARMGISVKTVENQLAKALAYITKVIGTEAEALETGTPSRINERENDDREDQRY